MSSTETSEVMKPDPVYFGSKSLSDLTLIVKNSEFHVHRMTLASRSDVFEAMLYGEFKESKEDRIEIKDVGRYAFRRFLEIIYTGKTSDPDSFGKFRFVGGLAQNIHVSSSETFYSKFLTIFWFRCASLLKIADRFNMTPIVKDYMELLFNNDISKCEKTDCQLCFTIFFFSLFHDVDLSNCPRPKTYSKGVYGLWFEQGGKKVIPETCSGKVVEYLISQIAK